MTVNSRDLAVTLARFYEFEDKVALYVGAGGAQLLTPDVRIKRMIAIDQNAETLRKLKTNIVAQGIQDSVEVVASDFQDVVILGDVVYFEFCLHEITDPYAALTHARALAPDIVIFDHLPGSEWSFYAAEEEKVRRSNEAMERFVARRHEVFRTEQRFADYEQLHAKLASQGTVAVERARRHFAGSIDIAIPMPCQLALL